MPNIDAVEQAAMQGKPMPPSLDIFDQFRYHGLSYIYHNYRQKIVNKAAASEYKKSLLHEIDALRAEYAFAIKCYSSAAERHKNTELAISAFMQDKTVNNAMQIVNALNGFADPGRDRKE